MCIRDRSTTGHAAEIPADIAYTVVNGTYENGVLTATAVGDVVLTATYNGKDCLLYTSK